jgi:ApeA-like protein
MGDKVIRLDEEFVSKGVFWNPKMGEQKSFSANLTYNPEEGIELDAATVPIEFKDLAQSELEEMEFLVGALADGTPCSLFRVRPWGGSKVWSGGAVCLSNPAFRAQFAVIGQAARAAHQPTFDEMHISYEVLTTLCGLPKIEHENKDGDVTVLFPSYADPLMSSAVGDATIETRFQRRLRVGLVGHAEGEYKPVITVVPAVAEDFAAILKWVGTRVSWIVGTQTVQVLRLQGGGVGLFGLAVLATLRA